jgi:hypothetical protein
MSDQPAPVPIPTVPQGETAEAQPARRTFLLGSGFAVAAGATIGVVIGSAVHKSEASAPPAPPQTLVDAIAHEVTLIALIDAVANPSADLKRSLDQARADHVEHERVLRGMLPYGTSPVTITSPTMAPATVAAVRSAETRAAQVAAKSAAGATGSTAALLACISACEASHAELLS